MVWECVEKSWDETSWQDLRSAEEMWEELRRCERRREEMRRHKMSWQELRRAEKSWDELWKFEKSWENLRKAEISRDEMRRDEKSSGDMRSYENSCDQLRKGEKTWDGIRWDEVKKAEKISDQLRWVEMMRWDGMTQTAVTVGCSEQFPREAAMRWDKMKWEKIQHSRDMASDWQVKRLLLRSTWGLPVTYRHSLRPVLQAIGVSNLKLPPPACPSTTSRVSSIQGGAGFLPSTVGEVVLLLWKNVLMNTYTWCKSGGSCM